MQACGLEDDDWSAVDMPTEWFGANGLYDKYSYFLGNDDSRFQEHLWLLTNASVLRADKLISVCRRVRTGPGSQIALYRVTLKYWR